MFIVDLFKARCRLEAENLFLRHQLNIALRRPQSRLRLRGSDRALLIWMTKLWPSLLSATLLVQPETILRWHRAGFKAFRRWKSRNRAGRPNIDRGLRDLIRRMSRENPLWGASRIHGELLMLGFEVAQSTVSKYMARPSRPPSQTWKTFLQNHAETIAAIDMCVIPTLTFDLLFAFLIVGHGRRQLLWFEVARRPTAEWLARQITEAFPCPFRKFHPAWIRVLGQNRRIMQSDGCDPSCSWNVPRRPFQVPQPAGSRDAISPPSVEYRIASGAASALAG